MSHCSELGEVSLKGRRNLVFGTFSPFFRYYFPPELMDEQKEFEDSTWRFTLEEIMPIAAQYSETREVNPVR